MPKVHISVAMCTYNGARFLGAQLESIAAQGRLPDELVVCDDGSTDGSVGIIRAFGEGAPFAVRLEVNPTTLGSTKNFEKAIGLCRGEIIALADQDDVWKSQKLAVLERVLEEHTEAGYAFSDAELIDVLGRPVGRGLWETAGFDGVPIMRFRGNDQFAILLRRAVITGTAVAFRASLRSDLLPISSHVVHDYWISLVASCVGAYGIPICEKLVQYRQHNEQQIGALRMSIREKVRWVRQVGAGEYSNRTQGYVDLRERLLATAARPTDHLALLEEKIKHCSERAAAHSARGPAKVRRVVSEVFSGRYALYSNSWASVFEDLCF